MPWPFLPHGNNPPVPIGLEAGGPQSQSKHVDQHGIIKLNDSYMSDYFRTSNYDQALAY
jgi:hypothetical protein